jgi:hypothetical protein
MNIKPTTQTASISRRRMNLPLRFEIETIPGQPETVMTDVITQPPSIRPELVSHRLSRRGVLLISVVLVAIVLSVVAGWLTMRGTQHPQIVRSPAVVRPVDALPLASSVYESHLNGPR